MADKDIRKMAKPQVKSLVSEQYLDGWSYDDKDSSNTQTSQSASSDQKMTGFSIKRQHSGEQKGSGDSEPTEKKKICMSLSSKTKAAPAGPTVGKLPPLPGKISMNVGSSFSKSKAAPIKMNLSSQSKSKESSGPGSLRQSNAVAKAFGSDSDESEDEMPAEARMRMRNIGRETPTAAGPNSFGKGRLGFCDRQRVIERELQKNVDD